MKTPRWIVLVFVLIAVCAFCADGLERCVLAYARVPRSLRILLLWVAASALLITLFALAYARGVDDGFTVGFDTAIQRRLVRPSRAAIDAHHFRWPEGAHLEARRSPRVVEART